MEVLDMVAKLKRKSAAVSDSEISKTTKVEASEVEIEVPAPKKAKKVSSKTTKKATKESVPAVGYVAGGLSGLFGKKSEDNEEEVPAEPVGIPVGETTITPKTKKEKPVKVKEEGRDKQRENRKKQKMTPDEKKRTIFVGNMPVSADVKQVKKMFSECGQVDSVRVRGIIPTTEKLTKRVAHMTGEYSEKQNSLYFYVKFKEEASVAEALKKSGEILDGHKIRVDKVTGKKEYDKGHTIYVGNLPFSATEDAVSAFFEEQVGPVTCTRLVRDSATGKGKGYAFVYFKDASSLDLALGMAGIEFEGRELRISKVLKKAQLAKQQEAMKKKGKKSKEEKNKQPSKIDKYKFSNRKTKSSEIPEKPRLKKSAKKAILKKKAGGKKTLMK